ncbi:MAG: tRNA preQ1(34) S-adenosylmethionine ribosyltransferase-isomerase QueA [Candidatus Berkelbacteria bacterium]|nr:tRNA preQ1(34) S-adenosylmethionine ribosyltransferase-isomerase QueA [Candidatus Berkelbacteria bacterium]
MIKISDFDYNLPKELIAQVPVSPRDNSRLLVYESCDDEIADEKFFNLGNFLRAGDLVVVNNSKVMSARIFGAKLSGGKIEILLLEKVGDNWSALVGGKINVGEKIFLEENFFANINSKSGKEAVIKFNLSGEDFWQKINQIGIMPLPPYIEKKIKIQNSKIIIKEDFFRKEYQTVYAKNLGSAAAPTAGLHFTEELIKELESAGINFASVDLHVGLGTFLPIDEENIKSKKLHRENFSIPAETIAKIIETKKSGGRIIAVGTTTVRALESFWKDQKLKIKDQNDKSKIKKDFSGSTDIFIHPGFDFKIVDGLITNFHLPKSSLMMLVAAFIQYKVLGRHFERGKRVEESLEISREQIIGANFGRQKLLELYNLAIKNQYRFYSFGDAILIV